MWGFLVGFSSSLSGNSAKRVFAIVPGNPSSLEKCVIPREMDTRVKPAYDGLCDWRGALRPGGSFVFSAFQDARHHAVADQFPDRNRPGRCGSAGDTLGVARTQAADRLRHLARDMRVLAAG